METLTLWVDSRWYSPYAMTAFVALTEKGLDFDVEEVDLDAGEARTYGARTGRVPMLRHGEYELAESMAIAEYCAETFPYPHAADVMLFPPDLRERGICREVMMWLRSDLDALRRERPTSTVFGAPTDVPLSGEGQIAASRLLAACERWLPDDRPTLFERWCIADPDLALMLMRLIRSGDPVPERARRYAEGNWQRPSVKSWVEHPR